MAADPLAGVDIAALAQWMNRTGLSAGPVRDATALAGGSQNILVRFVCEGKAFVLRRPPLALRANSNATMLREARVLTALAQTAVPHPKLIAACPDERVLGAAFYLMEPVDGFNPHRQLAPMHASSAMVRHRMGLALVEGIAALAALDYQALGLHDFGKPAGFIERQVHRWSTQLNSYAEYAGWPGRTALPGVENIVRWLCAHQPGEFSVGLVHGDCHLANVLYRYGSPELAAILDWELATIGDPLMDLSWLLATWPEPDHPSPVAIGATPWEGFPSSRELVEHYGKVTRRSLVHLQWYSVLACFKLGVIVEGTYARACAGLVPQSTGDRLHARAINAFERAARWIEA